MGCVAKLTLLLSICFSLSVSAGLRPMIVGGSDAAEGEFPFIVSLQHNSMGHFCGGSLIKNNWILTAGHCVEGGYTNKIYLGLHDQNDVTRAELRTPKRVIRHPLYNERNIDYDFALIELDSPSSYPPVAINKDEILIPSQPEPQIMSVAAGWGETQGFKPMNSADRLQKVEVPLVSADVCNHAYPGDVTDRMLCAGFSNGGKDSCSGDSGGPLTMTDSNGVTKLIGVVSWGEGCARPNKYGVYSKVNAVTAWIEQTTL